MFEILITEEFQKRYKKLPVSIQHKIEKQEKLFRQNPFYPSLHTEKLQPKTKEYWSFRVARVEARDDPCLDENPHLLRGDVPADDFDLTRWEHVVRDSEAKKNLGHDLLLFPAQLSSPEFPDVDKTASQNLRTIARGFN